MQALTRAWRAFVDQLVAEWLHGQPFSEDDLMRVLCGNLASLLETARPLEPAAVAQVSLSALRG